MALSMGQADYARDAAGRKKLVSDLQGDIDVAIKALTGAEYNAVLQAVNAYWVGADAEQFKKNLKESANELAGLFKNFKSQIQSAADTDAKRFASMQSSNATAVKNAKTKFK